MAVDPQSGEGLGARCFRRCLRVVAILLEELVRMISEPVDGRQDTHFARAALAQVGAQTGDETGVLRPAQLATPTTLNHILHFITSTITSILYP